MQKQLMTNLVAKQNFLNPQLLMALELITIELLATYALTH
jgi:hypothetical protein